MNKFSTLSLFTVLFLVFRVLPCSGGEGSGPAMAVPAGHPSLVEIRRLDSGFQLYRNGAPYYIKGVGGRRFLESAATAGANSVRTWGTQDAAGLLDRASALRMTVMLGVWLSHDPADYEDPAYRRKKTEEVIHLVQRYKGHAALLLWALGNEINLEGADTESAWRFVDSLARLIKSLDSRHPVVSVIACRATTLGHIADYAPALDAVGINAYGALAGVRAMMDASAYSGPYLVTEWGVTGHWEARQTLWGRPIEPTSTWKAEYQLSRYHRDILANRDRCVGSYVFLWGQKQERTPTWYSMILEDIPGSDDQAASPMVEAMHRNWTGRWPANRAPQVSALRINGTPAEANIILCPGAPMVSRAEARDPENDPLTYVWELLEEPDRLGTAGSHEDRPPRAAGIVRDTLPVLNLNAPLEAGQYRLFVYVLDSNGHAATANIPFRVRPAALREAGVGDAGPGKG